MISRPRSPVCRSSPGVYLYSNEAGETLYVGKARVLRDRVRSYLGAQGMSPRIDALLDEAQRLEVIVTDSVVEALALENHLIKQRSPKYNILLRDDKNYPYLQLTTGEAFPRVLVARRVERDDHFYAGPFMPASLARKTMSLTHRLFGIRSCNEVDHRRARPAVPRVRHQALRRAVRRARSARKSEYRVAVEHTRLFLEGRNDELVDDAARADDRGGRPRSGSSRPRSCATRIRTIETLRDRQQKMASPELGDRDAFGLKLGPAGAVVQVFQMRGGRVVERIELVTDPARSAARRSTEAAPAADGDRRGRPAGLTECDVLQAALQQFYADHAAPPEVHVPVPFPTPTPSCSRTGSPSAAERRVRIVVPQRGEKRGLLDLAVAQRRVAYQARFNENVAAHYDALETLRAVLALPVAAAPHRVLRHLDDPGQRDRRVDGRLRRRPDEAGGIPEVPDPGLAAAGSGLGRAAGDRRAIEPPADRVPATAADVAPACRAPSRRAAEPRILDDFASMHEVVLRRYRKLLENGGPFPGPDPDRRRQGQLSAAYEALEELGLGSAGGGRHRQEGGAAVHARSRGRRSRCREDSPALLLIQRIRDEAHRFAVTFHRAVADEARSALGARRDRRDRPAAPQGAADGLRQRSPASGARPARSWCGWSAPSPPTPCSRISPMRRALQAVDALSGFPVLLTLSV